MCVCVCEANRLPVLEKCCKMYILINMFLLTQNNRNQCKRSIEISSQCFLSLLHNLESKNLEATLFYYEMYINSKIPFNAEICKLLLKILFSQKISNVHKNKNTCLKTCPYQHSLNFSNNECLKRFT